MPRRHSTTLSYQAISLALKTKLTLFYLAIVDSFSLMYLDQKRLGQVSCFITCFVIFARCWLVLFCHCIMFLVPAGGLCV